jgi:hypothetical protein
LVLIHNDDSVTLRPQSSQDELIVGSILALLAKGGSCNIRPNGMRGLNYGPVGVVDTAVDVSIQQALDRYISPFEPVTEDDR